MTFLSLIWLVVGLLKHEESFLIVGGLLAIAGGLNNVAGVIKKLFVVEEEIKTDEE